MGMYLSELIEQANICLKDLGLSSGTIDDYQCSAFRPIESILVICQELFEKGFDMDFRKKGNFKRPSVEVL